MVTKVDAELCHKAMYDKYKELEQLVQESSNRDSVVKEIESSYSEGSITFGQHRSLMSDVDIKEIFDRW